MKQCLKCNQVFDENYSYCLSDGEPLIEQPPQDSVPTLVNHSPPIFVEVKPNNQPAEWNTPTIQSQIPFIPVVPQAPFENKDHRKTYVALLLTGILFGGGLVLLTVFLMNKTKPNPTETASLAPANKNPNENSNPTQANSAVSSNTNANPENTNTNVNTAENKKDNDNKQPDKNSSTENPDSKKREKRKGYNGRVVMLNALVRIAPSMDAMPLGYLDYDSPIKIGKKAAPNSPWYRVTTPSGISGWMHGNTIEFVR